MTESDTKTHPRYLVLTTIGALGVVFGDIGTSPLYAFRETFLAAEGLEVNIESVMGILSLMFWSLVIVVSVKYLGFLMRADNQGEGGIMALTALAAGRGVTTWDASKRALLLVGLFGTALLYGDGIITPAISVLSAVEGLEVLTPELDPYVVPVAATIILVLFLVQRVGTGKVGAAFGPVMLIWFTTLATLGITQIIRYPRVLMAVSPTYALTFVGDHPYLSFLALGAIFLVVTGSEALYADMGHFGKRPIRIAWFSLVFPALLLNYYGQGALMISRPEVINPFYQMAPNWALVPLIVLATMATIIASQALISAAYSLTMQAVQLGYLPRLRIDHTSEREYGQVYIGTVNWLLMLACIGVVFSFGSSSNLAAAYGVAVTTTMVITTTLFYIVMRHRWGWSRFVAGGLTTIFMVVDLAFFFANILKIPQGGWFPLAVGLLVMGIMITWKLGRLRLSKELRKGDLPIERFIGSIVSNPQPRVPGTAVYLAAEVGTTPPALLANLRNNGVIHETVLLVSVQWVSTPRVPKAARATRHELGEGFYQVVLQFGFLELADVPKALEELTVAGFGFDPTDAVYFLGKESVIMVRRRGIRSLPDRLFALMHRNATSAANFFHLPAKRVMEVGVQVEL
ncbi:MAG: potassium transporter Kup [Acidimicrobiia bacterium]